MRSPGSVDVWNEIVISTLGNKIEFIARPFFYSRGRFSTEGLPEVEKKIPESKKGRDLNEMHIPV